MLLNLRGIVVTTWSNFKVNWLHQEHDWDHDDCNSYKDFLNKDFIPEEQDVLPYIVCWLTSKVQEFINHKSNNWRTATDIGMIKWISIGIHIVSLDIDRS